MIKEDRTHQGGMKFSKTFGQEKALDRALKELDAEEDSKQSEARDHSKQLWPNFHVYLIKLRD